MADGEAHFDFTPEVEANLAPLWEKLRTRVTPLEWRLHAPLIDQINRLKREKNAVVLAHNYMTPDIFHGVGDFVGDSLGLAREAARSSAKIIVQAGVHFMAETSKVLCPDKTVLIPDQRAGCSLAASRAFRTSSRRQRGRWTRRWMSRTRIWSSSQACLPKFTSTSVGEIMWWLCLCWR